MEIRSRSPLFRGALLLTALACVGIALFAWKASAGGDAPAAATEPSEAVQIVTAEGRPWRRMTTTVGTVVAARSIMLRNEVPGTVARVAMSPGAVVAAGDLLLQLDVSLERAELASYESQARLTAIRLQRLEQLGGDHAVSKMDVDTARAESEVALAQVRRVQALIARKTLRAPFRARIGITDLDVGQYIAEGQLLTTLQGVDEHCFVDFRVPQAMSLELRPGGEVTLSPRDPAPLRARIVAMDSLVEASSRSVMVRARASGSNGRLVPGAAVTVQLPASATRDAVIIPPSAVRRGPDGDFVFVVRREPDGELRAQQRRVVVEAVEDDSAIIVQGLAAGERVTAAGSFKLRDELRVTEAKN